MSSTAYRKAVRYIGRIVFNTNYPRLEEMRKVTSARQGSYKFYFPYGIFKDNEKNILQVLSQDTARKILMFIIERNNPTHTDIVNSIGISAAL